MFERGDRVVAVPRDVHTCAVGTHDDRRGAVEAVAPGRVDELERSVLCALEDRDSAVARRGVDVHSVRAHRDAPGRSAATQARHRLRLEEAEAAAADLEHRDGGVDHRRDVGVLAVRTRGDSARAVEAVGEEIVGGLVVQAERAVRGIALVQAQRVVAA